MQERTSSSRPQSAADEYDAAQLSVADSPHWWLAPGVLNGSGWEWNSPMVAEQEARRMFHRTLSAWAMDVLALRRRGLDKPRRLARSMGLVTPCAA